MKLYVRSVSTGAIQRSPGLLTHTCDMEERRSVTFFPKEDEEAMELLREKDIPFDVVDLCKRPLITRLKARITGINKTPTLVLENNTKLTGINQIKAHFLSEYMYRE